jgi:glycerol-3-phosphate acyltransferase PlsY
MGAIPIGVIVGKLTRGIDIRQFGSGNIGATNVLRTLGPGPAAIVMIGDTLKGFLAVLLCKELVGLPYVVVLGAFLSILGHNFSIFLGFKGGKGVATSLGMIVGFHWLIGLCAFGIWVLLVGVIRYISIASSIAALSVPAMMFFAPQLFHTHIPVVYQVISLIAALLIVVKHRSNFARLAKGTEPKVGQKVKIEGN